MVDCVQLKEKKEKTSLGISITGIIVRSIGRIIRVILYIRVSFTIIRANMHRHIQSSIAFFLFSKNTRAVHYHGLAFKSIITFR